MRSNLRAVTSALLVALAALPACAATKAEVAAKAGAVVKKVEAQLPAGAAELKSKAASALSTLPADAARALQGAKGQQNFTPEQLTQIQAQSGQILTNLTADPRAAAAAAQAGVTSQKLNALQAQTAAAVAGLKGPDGKPNVEAAGQQAREFMKSEQATNFKAQANETLSRVAQDPKVAESARTLGKEVREVAGEVKEKTGLALPGKHAALSPHNAEAYKERAVQALETEGGTAAAAATFESKAQQALVKFCKKYEGKTAVPARCKKPKPAPAE